MTSSMLQRKSTHFWQYNTCELARAASEVWSAPHAAYKRTEYHGWLNCYKRQGRSWVRFQFCFPKFSILIHACKMIQKTNSKKTIQFTLSHLGNKNSPWFPYWNSKTWHQNPHLISKFAKDLKAWLSPTKGFCSMFFAVVVSGEWYHQKQFRLSVRNIETSCCFKGAITLKQLNCWIDYQTTWRLLVCVATFFLWLLTYIDVSAASGTQLKLLPFVCCLVSTFKSCKILNIIAATSSHYSNCCVQSFLFHACEGHAVTSVTRAMTSADG